MKIRESKGEKHVLLGCGLGTSRSRVGRVMEEESGFRHVGRVSGGGGGGGARKSWERAGALTLGR